MPVLLPSPSEYGDLPLPARRKAVQAAMRLLDGYGHPAWPIPIPQPKAKRWTDMEGAAVREEATRLLSLMPVDPDWREHVATLEQIA
jgi:uncharacterized protein YdaT